MDACSGLPFVDNLLFELGALEIDFLDILALQDEFLLVFQRNGGLLMPSIWNRV